MTKRFTAELPRKQILYAGSELSTPRLADSALTDAASYRRRGCVEHRRRDQLDVRVCIGIGSDIFSSSCVLVIRGSPRVSVPEVGMRAGKPRTATLVKEVPSFRPGRWSWRVDPHRPGQKAVPGFAIVPSQD
jgi:hypothetical protein